MKHKRKDERKATTLNYKLNEEVNVNPDTSPSPSARICSVQVSDLQGLSEEFIVFKRVPFHSTCSLFVHTLWAGMLLLKVSCCIDVVLLRNALQISQQGTGGIFHTLSIKKHWIVGSLCHFILQLILHLFIIMLALLFSYNVINSQALMKIK